MTQKLFEACSTQADYQIPQASEKGASVPTTESGEHLGVGDSWWYRGKQTLDHYGDLARQALRWEYFRFCASANMR